MIDYQGSKLSPQGIRFGGRRYQLIGRLEEQDIYYLKSLEGGATVAISKLLVIVAIWSSGKGQNGGKCNLQTESFFSRIIDAGY